jgi:thiamine transport system permease protein
MKTRQKTEGPPAITSPRFFAGAILLIFFTAPFWILIAWGSAKGVLGLTSVSFSAPLFSLIYTAALQAFLSSIFSLGFGLLGALGLLGASRLWPRSKTSFESLSLVPNVVPVLLMLLAFLKAAPSLRGLAGVVSVHVLLNTGLISVALARVLRRKVGRMAELAWIEGAGRVRFLAYGVVPMLRSELLQLGLFIFALSFTSFAVPLVIGGSGSATLEVSIYQALRISGDFSQALSLAILQSGAVFVFAWCLQWQRQDESAAALANLHPETRLPLLYWTPGLMFALFPSVFLLWGAFDGLSAGYRELLSLPTLLAELNALFLGSFVIGTGAGLSCAAVLLLLAYLNPRARMRRLLVSYLAPSTALVAFSLLVIWREFGWASYVKIVAGLSLIFIPGFYRLQWDGVLSELQQQRVVADSLGASEAMIFFRIVYPQVIESCCLIAGLASIWAWGDFALSMVVAERTMTLAMVTQSLMESYRLNAATVLVWLIGAGALLSFAIFNGVGRVLGSKFKT